MNWLFWAPVQVGGRAVDDDDAVGADVVGKVGVDVGPLDAADVGVAVCAAGADELAAAGLGLAADELEPPHAAKVVAIAALANTPTALALPLDCWNCMTPPLGLVLVPRYWLQPVDNYALRMKKSPIL